MTGREDVFNRAMNEGHSAAWDQTWDKASKFYETALQEFPDNPKALKSYGLALFESHHLDESLLAYEHAAKSSPLDPVPFEHIAQISKILGKNKLAVQAAMQAAAADAQGRNWWDLLAALAVVVLVMEAVVANRRKQQDAIPAHLSPAAGN